MSSQSVAAFMLERLKQWGVTRIYGYPGDGINGILGAFHEFEDDIEFIQTRHEEIASFAACAHAKFTGEVGVCMATSGPGAIHLMNGLYDAKLDHQPVVAIVGQQARMALGSHFQQEVDLTTLFKDVASEYVQVCMAPEQAAHLIDRAFRIAKATRSVTCVIFPNDIQEAPYSAPPRAHGAVPSSVGFLEPVVRPRDDDLRRAADLLNAGQKVAMLVGAGAIHAEREVVDVADLLGAGVAKALNGRAAVPDDLPFVTGSIGLLGTKATYDMMEGCDTLLMVGSSFPYSEWLPEFRPGSRRADRHRPPDDRDALPDGDQPRRRQRRDAAGPDPVAAPPGGPVLAREDRGRRAPLVGDPRRAGARIGRPDQPTAACSTSSASACPTGRS